MPRISFHPGFNGLMMLGIALGATLLVAVFYRRAFGALGRRQWMRLYLLRMTAILLVLLLLFRPVLSFQKQLKQRRAVVLLVDTSASMSIADEAQSGTRLDHVRSLVATWQPQLAEDFQVRLVAFADSASPLKGQEQLAQLEPDGQATSLARALTAVPRAAEAAKVEAVFLLSDGIDNSAGNPLEAAGRLGVPVYTVGVGAVLRDRLSYRDIRVADLDCPEQLAVGNRARLTAYVDAVGLPGRVTKVVFEEDGKPVGEQELVLDDVEGLQEVTVEFVPSEKGLHTYTARVPVAPEEKIAQNNERSDSALVLDARIQVLYVEGTLRPEYGALVGRFLAKDPNVEYCALVQTRPNVFMQRTNIDGLDLKTVPQDAEALDRFDVFLLGDLDSSYLRSGQLELIAQRVRQGGGLLMMGGYHSLGPGGYGGSALEKVLPVFVGDRQVGQITEPFVPLLTADGRRHPIFANIVRFFPTENAPAEVEGLPPLEGCTRVAGVKPGATVLAVHPTERTSDGRPMPVMVVQRVGDGRAAVFTGDTTRNWHQTLRTMERESPFLRFWGQTVRWLAGRSDQIETGAGITVTTDKAYYEPESEMTITASVRGDEGEGIAGARVTALIRDPRGWQAEWDLPPQPGPAGHYQGVYQPPSAGEYRIQVQAQLEDGQTMKAEPLTVHVGRPNLEYERLDLDQKMLVNIANQTGGRYAHITTADRLIDELKRQRRQQLVTLEMAVAWPPLFWLLFVVALTAEWVLRRRYQLR